MQLLPIDTTKAALSRMEFQSEHARDQWRAAMQLEYMSSEESDLDDDGEVLLLHPLTWRSEKSTVRLSCWIIV